MLKKTPHWKIKPADEILWYSPSADWIFKKKWFASNVRPMGLRRGEGALQYQRVPRVWGSWALSLPGGSAADTCGGTRPVFNIIAIHCWHTCLDPLSSHNVAKT